MTHSTFPPAFVYLFPGRHNEDILNYILLTMCLLQCLAHSLVWLLGAYPLVVYQCYSNTLRIVRASSLIIPSGFRVDGTSVMDDLTSLLGQLAKDRNGEQDRCESDWERRRQDDERLRTQIFEVMGHRTAAASEVAPGVSGERVRTVTSAEEVRGVSSSGSLPALGQAVGLPRSGASSSV